MSATIEFYFDFSSPYAYLASRRIESIAEKHGRTLNWHPILLGAIFKISGQQPLLETPMIGDYALLDLERCAREHAIEYRLPEPCPIATVNAARAVYWVGNTDKQQAVALIHALFRAYFVDNINLSETDNVLTIAANNGIDKTALSQALQQPEVKAQLKNAVDAAVDKGIFGTPCCIIDGQLFWGNDRIDQLDKWLSTGGW